VVASLDGRSVKASIDANGIVTFDTKVSIGEDSVLKLALSSPCNSSTSTSTSNCCRSNTSTANKTTAVAEDAAANTAFWTSYLTATTKDASSSLFAFSPIQIRIALLPIGVVAVLVLHTLLSWDSFAFVLDGMKRIERN